MKRKLSCIFLILSAGVFLLNGCEQKLQFDLKDQVPVPVVNSILGGR